MKVPDPFLPTGVIAVKVRPIIRLARSSQNDLWWRHRPLSLLLGLGCKYVGLEAALVNLLLLKFLPFQRILSLLKLLLLCILLVKAWLCWVISDRLLLSWSLVWCRRFDYVSTIEIHLYVFVFNYWFTAIKEYFGLHFESLTFSLLQLLSWKLRNSWSNWILLLVLRYKATALGSLWNLVLLIWWWSRMVWHLRRGRSMLLITHHHCTFGTKILWFIHLTLLLFHLRLVHV